MNRALYPGSFDPVTKGHFDIIERASRLYDEVLVAVSSNPAKMGLFTPQERLALLRETVTGVPNVRSEAFDGLTVDYCVANDISVVIRGVRVANDFAYELQMAQMNYKLSGVETVFMTTNPSCSFVASSLVKEIARYGGDVSPFVSAVVAEQLKARCGASGR